MNHSSGLILDLKEKEKYKKRKDKRRETLNLH